MLENELNIAPENIELFIQRRLSKKKEIADGSGLYENTNFIVRIDFEDH